MFTYPLENPTKLSSSECQALDSLEYPQPDRWTTGQQLLSQLEKDLKEFEKLMYGEMRPSSPPEIDTDSLEETLRGLQLMGEKHPQIEKITKLLSARKKEEDSDSDTVKSNESNFSCDSLDDDDDDDADDDSDKIPTKQTSNSYIPAKNAPVKKCLKPDVPSTLPIQRRKRQRWQRLSLGGKTYDKKPDFESDVFPTNEAPANTHYPVFRTSSDSALAHSDSSHSDLPTPTNPPFFSVRSPPTPNQKSLPKKSDIDEIDDENAVTMLTVEHHSYCLERPSSDHHYHRQYPKREGTPPTKGPKDFPVEHTHIIPPGTPPTVYLTGLTGAGISAPGRAHRVLLAKKVTIQQVLPSKRKQASFNAIAVKKACGMKSFC